MARLAQHLWRDESGQDVAEYGLLIALIALVALGAVTAVGTAVAGLWGAQAEAVAELPSAPE